MNDLIKCHDCQKEAIIENDELKNGVIAVYNSNGKKIKCFKCNECFSKNKSLGNFETCEVYSRIVGYLRPVHQWNTGKQKEFEDRKEFTSDFSNIIKRLIK